MDRRSTASTMLAKMFAGGRDSSVPVPKAVRTLWNQSHGAEMSWVQSVLGPKCLVTFSHIHQCSNTTTNAWSYWQYDQFKASKKTCL